MNQVNDSMLYDISNTKHFQLSEQFFRQFGLMYMPMCLALCILLIFHISYLWTVQKTQPHVSYNSCALSWKNTRKKTAQNNRCNRSITFGTFQFQAAFKCNEMHFWSVSHFSVSDSTIWLHLKAFKIFFGRISDAETVDLVHWATVWQNKQWGTYICYSERIGHLFQAIMDSCK